MNFERKNEVYFLGSQNDKNVTFEIDVFLFVCLFVCLSLHLFLLVSASVLDFN